MAVTRKNGSRSESSFCGWIGCPGSHRATSLPDCNKPIDVEFVPENEPQLSIPPAILQIALTNLIRNAIQHTAAGKISVIVKADRAIVSDTGAGMEPEELKLDTQSHGRRDPNKGFGLGLSIVQRLCDRLGWKLEIESKIGLGTTVKLIFQTVKK